MQQEWPHTPLFQYSPSSPLSHTHTHSPSFSFSSSPSSPSNHDEWSDCKLSLLHKEAIIQFIVRSPLLLASAVPADYAEALRRPLNSEEMDERIVVEAIPRMFHRLGSMSNTSDLSSRNSINDGDSESGGEFVGRAESGEKKMGTALLRENPFCSFEEMMELMKNRRENEETIFQINVGIVNELKAADERIARPGSNNKAITLMM